MPYTGQPLKRCEAPKLVTGRGAFVDDIQLPDMLHAAMVRSSLAHARLRAIDVTVARRMVGVVAVLTGADITGVVGDVPTRAMRGGWDVDEMHPVEQPVLARDTVCYVGQPIAIVVAQNRSLAQDAVTPLQVDYDPLPPVLDPLVALQAEAAPRHATLGTNVGLRVSHAGGDVAAAFAQAERVLQQRSHVPRLAPPPLATRGGAAAYQPQEDVLTVWNSTQAPHRVQHEVAQLLDRPESQLHLDPAEVRRHNLLAPETFPYTTPTGVTYDSGDYARGLDRVLALADDERARARRSGQAPLLGIGVAPVVQASGASGADRVERAQVDIAPSGYVTVSTGVAPHGQGAQTTFAQSVADALGVSPSAVQGCHGATAVLPSGGGTGASRGLTVGGSAFYTVLQQARQRVVHLAAHLLQCPAEAGLLQDGRVYDRRHPAQVVSFAAVAAAA